VTAVDRQQHPDHTHEISGCSQPVTLTMPENSNAHRGCVGEQLNLVTDSLINCGSLGGACMNCPSLQVIFKMAVDSASMYSVFCVEAWSRRL
jgi:hypothetical protein